MKDFKEIIGSGPSKEKLVEFGLVAILTVNVLSKWLDENNLIYYGIGLCLLTILTPLVFWPFAIIWYWIAECLSTIGSTVILSVIFFLVVTPVGLLRKFAGKDNLMLKQFKKDTKSVLRERNHLFHPKDMTQTF